MQSDLKNTTDDALPNYLASLNFEQSNFLTDVRLALGYSAVIIAAVTFYFDYKFGWDETKDYTLWAVVVYFLLNGALTLWIWFVEQGKVFTGTSNGTMVRQSTKPRTLLTLTAVNRLQCCEAYPDVSPHSPL